MKVRFNQDAQVNTPVGPANYILGEVIEVDSGFGESLKGLGLVNEVDEKAEQAAADAAKKAAEEAAKAIAKEAEQAKAAELKAEKAAAKEAAKVEAKEVDTGVEAKSPKSDGSDEKGGS